VMLRTVRIPFVLAFLWAVPLAGQTLPPGFTDALVASVGAPTAFAFTPDGRLLVARQAGELRVIVGGSLLPAPALTLPVCSNSERGLLGVAVDPQFAVNGHIYLYYTFDKFGSCASNVATSPVNRISRFVLPASSFINPSTEVVLVDGIPSPNGNHNGGDLQFGKDGYLYASVGDGGCYYQGSRCSGPNPAARELNAPLGKILRIARDGSIPPDNPFVGAGTARCNQGPAPVGTACQEVFAFGLRNPFRIAFDPNATGTRFFIDDVGQSAWEEIDVAAAGADYGWNQREGPCVVGSTTSCGAPPAGMTNPIFAYRRDVPVPGTSVTGCATITGGAFVPNGLWPAPYGGAYLFGDFACGSLFRLDASGSSATAFATGLGGGTPVSVAFGPSGASQALYYTSYAAGGQIRKISYSGAGIACTPSATTHCLTANRFAVSVSWKNPYDGGSTGVGQTVPLTGDSGAFWFFTSSNLELAVKVLDGRAANGHFWVLYGAMSDVEYTLTVTDTVTGAVKTYFNPPRHLASLSDTLAF